MGSSSDSDPFQLLIISLVAAAIAALTSFVSATLAAMGEHRLDAFEDGREVGPWGACLVARRQESTKQALALFSLIAKLGVGATAGWLLSTGWQPVSWQIGGLVAGLFSLFVGSVLLQSLARRHPRVSFGWAAPVAAAMELIARPLVAPTVWLGGRLGKAPVLPRSEEDSTEELEYLIEKSSEAGNLNDEQRWLLESVMEFAHVRVREIMVPRPKVVALPVSASQAEVVRTIIDSGYSRIPVYDESVDHVVGILYAKRLLEELRGVERQRRGFRVADHLAEPFFVPETMRISHLLTEFQRRRLQMAVVVDEFGGTAGVVTLEDVVEEIVGEIRDESDREVQEPIRALGAGVLLAEGSVSIRDLEDFMEEALPELELELPKEGDFDTLGGFVTAMAGRVPKQGEQVRYGGFVFTVRGADQKRVAKVEIAWENEETEAAVLPAAATALPRPLREGVEEHLELPLPAEQGPTRYTAES